MKSKLIIKPLFALTVAAALASCAQHEEKPKQDPVLLAKAKVNQAQAEKTALTKAPDGTVTESELKEKKGKLLWSIEMSRPKTTNITEVKVDAKTGKIVKTEVEKPESKEKGRKEKEEDEEKEKAKQ